jgi:hypothetical protein
MPERVTIWTTPAVWNDSGARTLITQLARDHAALCRAAKLQTSPPLNERGSELLRCEDHSGPPPHLWVRIVPTMARKCFHPSPGVTTCKSQSAPDGPGTRIASMPSRPWRNEWLVG